MPELRLPGQLAAGDSRVLSRQWQGEFCRCSINVVGGKQRDGGINHPERFRHHTGPSPKAGKPMTQPTVDPGDVPAHVANGRALLINDYAASPLQARPPSLVAGAKRAA